MQWLSPLVRWEKKFRPDFFQKRLSFCIAKYLILCLVHRGPQHKGIKPTADGAAAPSFVKSHSDPVEQEGHVLLQCFL